jgi:ABC-type spermidine/putrescine transport system permease subunit II
MTPYSSSLAVYLTVVLAVALVVTAAALGTAAAVVVRSRRVRLTRHESLWAFYGPRLAPRLALHH